MANIKSAKKRISVNNRQKQENKFLKATINTAIKKYRKLVQEGNLTDAESKLKETIKLIDSSASKGVFHRNNASRKIARLSALLHKAKNANVEQPVTEVKVEQPVLEAEVVKEEVAKKPAVKKAPAKKATTTETVKKAPAKKASEVKVEEVKVEEKPAVKKAPAKKPATATATKSTTAKKPATKKAE